MRKHIEKIGKDIHAVFDDKELTNIEKLTVFETVLTALTNAIWYVFQHLTPGNAKDEKKDDDTPFSAN